MTHALIGYFLITWHLTRKLFETMKSLSGQRCKIHDVRGSVHCYLNRRPPLQYSEVEWISSFKICSYVTNHNLEQLDNYVCMQLQQSCYQAIEVKEPAVKKSSRVKKIGKSEGWEGDARKTLRYLISQRLLCLKVSSQRNQLISYKYSSGCVEDRSPRIFGFLCVPRDKSLSRYWVTGVEKSISYMADGDK